MTCDMVSSELSITCVYIRDIMWLIYEVKDLQLSLRLLVGWTLLFWKSVLKYNCVNAKITITFRIRPPTRSNEG